jgi:hypothetical protein
LSQRAGLQRLGWNTIEDTILKWNHVFSMYNFDSITTSDLVN